MHEIDFLPSEYRRRHDRQTWYDRRILLVTGLTAIIAAAAWTQGQRARRLEADLARCQPACAAAAQTRQTLDQLQSQLQRARTRAELITYLRHPWPRTRILAALLGPLPDNVHFEELAIEGQTPPAARHASSRSLAASEEQRRELAALAPAARDLKRLQDEVDPQQTIVTITGVTSDSAALHEYLGALGRERLFSKAQLQSSGIDPSDPTSIRFSVMLVVRPGYGQPGGPSGSDARPARETRPEDHLARR